MATDAPNVPGGTGGAGAAPREDGLERLRAGDFAGAIALLGRAVALDPADGRARFELGVALQGARRHPEAFAELTRAQALLPDEPRTFLHSAFSALALGKTEAALAAAETACGLTPKHAHAHFARGRALLDLGRMQEAEGAFATALEGSPKWADAWAQLGVARLRRGDAAGAEAAFREALRLAPAHPGASAQLAAIERARAAALAAAAMPAATPALREWRPDTPEAALGLAVLHLRKSPAFARLQFGEWSQVLISQISRGHYFFVVDAERKVRGFLGYALTNQHLAEQWVQGLAGLRNDQCLAGDCMIINAWSAESRRVSRFIVEALRELNVGRRMIYYKRHYPDGRTRPFRTTVNDFVASHLAQASERR